VVNSFSVSIAFHIYIYILYLRRQNKKKYYKTRKQCINSKNKALNTYLFQFDCLNEKNNGSETNNVHKTTYIQINLNNYNYIKII